MAKHVTQKQVHIEVDRNSKYELVKATLESLEGLGFKIGFVVDDPSKSQ
jgi:hypothetical protein